MNLHKVKLNEKQIRGWQEYIPMSSNQSVEIIILEIN